jgi:hypothetical protein
MTAYKMSHFDDSLRLIGSWVGATPNRCTYSLDLARKHSVSITEHSAILTIEYLVPEIENTTTSSAIRKIKDHQMIIHLPSNWRLLMSIGTKDA